MQADGELFEQRLAEENAQQAADMDMRFEREYSNQRRMLEQEMERRRKEADAQARAEKEMKGQLDAEDEERDLVMTAWNRDKGQIKDAVEQERERMKSSTQMRLEQRKVCMRENLYQYVIYLRVFVWKTNLRFLIRGKHIGAPREAKGNESRAEAARGRARSCASQGGGKAHRGRSGSEGR